MTFESGAKQTVIDPLKVRLVLEAADVIATTTTSAANVLLENMTFDTVILDEAAQIIEPSALIALTKGDRVILVGDHMQLPPIMAGEVAQIVEPRKKFYGDITFFTRIGIRTFDI